MSLPILYPEAKQRLSDFSAEILVVHPKPEGYTDSEWLDELTRQHWKRVIEVGGEKILKAAYVAKEIDLETA